MRQRPRQTLMPVLALVAGVGLVALEWREGFGFWMVVALILILFAVAALVFPGDAGSAERGVEGDSEPK
jgi:hypothetical protein